MADSLTRFFLCLPPRLTPTGFGHQGLSPSSKVRNDQPRHSQRVDHVRTCSRELPVGTISDGRYLPLAGHVCSQQNATHEHPNLWETKECQLSAPPY